MIDFNGKLENNAHRRRSSKGVSWKSTNPECMKIDLTHCGYTRMFEFVVTVWKQKHDERARSICFLAATVTLNVSKEINNITFKGNHH